jgi:hypothetical protein
MKSRRKSSNICPLRQWKKLVRESQDRLVRSDCSVAEDTDATNELINDGEFVQPLTVDEIQTLKRSGVHASVSNPVSHKFSLQDVVTRLFMAHRI